MSHVGQKLTSREGPVLAQSGRQEAAPLPPVKRGQNMRLGLKGKLDAL
jgi:hypothetical protein